MAYTAPSGNAVDFVFNGLAYSAPLGNAVDFRFAPEGVLNCALEFDYASVGVHGVRLTSNFALPFDVTAGVNVTPFARSDVRVELQFSIVGSTHVNGKADAALLLEISASGRAAPSGELAFELPLTVLAQALPSTSGRFSEPLVLQVNASGFVALLGVAAVPVDFEAVGVGALTPVANAQVDLRLGCLAAAEHKQAVSGECAVSVTIQPAISGGTGAGSLLSIPLSLTVQASGQRGAAGTCYGNVEIAVGATGASGVRGEVAVDLVIAAIGTYAATASQVLFVRTASDEVVIREF